MREVGLRPESEQVRDVREAPQAQADLACCQFNAHSIEQARKALVMPDEVTVQRATVHTEQPRNL